MEASSVKVRRRHAPTTGTRNRYRLDRVVEPRGYAIELEPDLARFRFTGHEAVTILPTRACSTIVLHAAELTITRARLQAADAAPLVATRITYDKALETATIHLPSRIPAGRELVLELDFEGTLNDKMHGFYRTSYRVGGRPRWGAATQFEATDARRAFPCWDEPDCKASFAVTLRVPRHLVALSNMPIAGEEPMPGTGLKRIRYQPSPRMPTYLLACVVADLECVEGRDANGVPIRVWTTPGKKAQGRFALDVAAHALAYFARWFGIPYALPKLDMVALPDFAAGAMENWGLVTYRETALLVDPKHSSAAARQRVAEVIAHELAHQWFGNLVTMAWWTDLWLNEGFASYMGPKAVDDQFPEWHIWSQYVAGEYLGALRNDSLRTSHPIEIPVHNPHEIREIFDAITYSKGSSVNRMLEHYLTEPVFRRGLQTYLTRYAYGNARTEDLWTVLQEASGKPVKAIMASFTKQAGYPLLIARPAPGRRGLALEQRRFFFDGRPDRLRQRWSVPLVATGGRLKQPVYDVLTDTRGRLEMPGTDGWIKLNAGQGGFYRTGYAPELQKRLAEAIARKDLPALDCLGVLDDTFALAQAGVVRTSAALDLVRRCSGYADYHVWATVAGILDAVENILEDERARERLGGMARAVFAPLLRRLGWDARRSDSHLDALLRALLIGRMGHYQDAATIDEARRRFARFIKHGMLSPDIRGAVYATVAEHGETLDYEALMTVYHGSDLQEEQVRVLRALTRFRRRELIRQALDLGLSAQVRKQDAYLLLAGFGSNPVGRPLAWPFIKAHWPAITSRYSNGGLGLLVRIIEGATSQLTTPAALRDVRKFFATHPVPGTERAMKRSLETIQATIRWAGRDHTNITRWLQALA
ncbi:MAG: M1 family metallopeptidase [Candidatus Omnitrophica bacterium]|nr:M1 family metallopeptidase [Candidatus Omnitrophota bacterium]